MRKLILFVICAFGAQAQILMPILTGSFPAGGGGGIAFISAGSSTSVTHNTVTFTTSTTTFCSAACNTTGASLIALLIGTDGADTFTVTDNAGNTYDNTTIPQNCVFANCANAGVQIYFVCGPTTSTSHTWTVTISAGTSPIGIASLAFSGTPTSLCHDAHASANTGGATSLAIGSVTPGAANELFIGAWSPNSGNTGNAITGGYTITASGTSYIDWTVAYLIATGSAAQNPTASWTTSDGAASVHAAFKHL